MKKLSLFLIALVMILVSCKPEVEKPTVVTKSVGEVTKTSAKVVGQVAADGGAEVTERGVCWSTDGTPTILDFRVKDTEGGLGSYEILFKDLVPNTQYYVRAYATNEAGTGYGDEKTFTTLDETPEEPGDEPENPGDEPETPEQPEEVAPEVTTAEVTEITVNSAKCGGEVINGGDAVVVARGVCWNTSGQPTVSDTYTMDGSNVGSFTSQISNLVPNTQYYVRAYATNEVGTAYGEERTFTTLELSNETITVNGVSFTMIAVEGGTFQMGATSEQGGDAYDDELPVHSVTLSRYSIGETEVTQELWEAVMGSNPSYYGGYPQRPVEYVSWNDCQEFIKKLNQLTGKNFRLPTEAEWEYAARGGNKSKGYKYSGSNTIDNVAWYSSSITHDVKTKQANELGIYDMSGNVWEWCQDWYNSSYYSSSAENNPTGPASGSYRVLRGGSWYTYAWLCRVSYRSNNYPGSRNDDSGLRLAL